MRCVFEVLFTSSIFMAGQNRPQPPSARHTRPARYQGSRRATTSARPAAPLALVAALSILIGRGACLSPTRGALFLGSVHPFPCAASPEGPAGCGHCGGVGPGGAERGFVGRRARALLEAKSSSLLLGGFLGPAPTRTPSAFIEPGLGLEPVFPRAAGAEGAPRGSRLGLVPGAAGDASWKSLLSLACKSRLELSKGVFLILARERVRVISYLLAITR